MNREEIRRSALARLAAGAGAAVLLASAASTAQSSEAVTSLSQEQVMITEFQGKPPFKRRVVSRDALSAVEIARLEPVIENIAVDQSRIGERVTLVDYRGKPPYARRTVEIDASNVVELARLEPAAADAPARIAPPRFPGKHLPGRSTR